MEHDITSLHHSGGKINPYTAEKTGNVYDFNTAEKLNQLLIKLLLATGQLAEGGEYDVQSFPFESFEDVKP